MKKTTEAALRLRRLYLALGVALVAAGPAAAQTYNEAPSLAALVGAGDLPAVEDRLPAEPLVQEVTDTIGTYGGTLRRGFLGRLSRRRWNNT